MRTKVNTSLGITSLGTGDNLVATQHTSNLKLDHAVVLSALALADEHGVKDVLVRRDLIRWPYAITR